MFNIRLKVVAAFVFLMMGAVIARLGYMQILRCEYYREEGRKRQVKDFSVPAPRGSIVARDGTVLAEDMPMLSISVVCRDFNTLSMEDVQTWYATLADIMGDSPENVAGRVQAVYSGIEARIEWYRNYTLNSGKDTPLRLTQKADRDAKNRRKDEYSQKQPLYVGVTWQQAVRAEAASPDLPGLAVDERMVRTYPMGELACHAIGYVREPTQDELDMYGDEYNGDELKHVDQFDVMGATGIEKQYNFNLKGSRGELKAMVNAHGQKQVILSDIQPQIGTTITLAIDPILQSVAENGLQQILNSENHPGAAVCMDVRTGEVLVLASCPGYNPNTFSQDYAALTDAAGLGKYHPLRNRAVSAAYPLGSVFKIITTTAGMESHTLFPSTCYTCEGIFHLGRGEYRCSIWNPTQRVGHGTIDLLTALKKSCNIYFYNAGLKAGGDNLNLWARRYGLGAPTGIDLPGETSGNLPMPGHPGDTINLSIGQGSLLVSPLQACRIAAAVATGGKLITPHLYRNAAVSQPDSVGISKSTLEALREGMYKAVNEQGGTAYTMGRTDAMEYAGKTGTAQAPPEGDQRGDHAWFAGFAPSDNPEIAFAIVVEHGGHGGTASAPVAKAIVEAYAAEKAGLATAAAGTVAGTVNQ